MQVSTLLSVLKEKHFWSKNKNKKQTNKENKTKQKKKQTNKQTNKQKKTKTKTKQNKNMFFACFESFTHIYLSIRVDNDFLIKTFW